MLGTSYGGGTPLFNPGQPFAPMSPYGIQGFGTSAPGQSPQQWLQVLQLVPHQLQKLQQIEFIQQQQLQYLQALAQFVPQQLQHIQHTIQFLAPQLQQHQPPWTGQQPQQMYAMPFQPAPQPWAQGFGQPGHVM